MYTHKYTCTLSLTHVQTHTHTCTHSLSHTHTHTHMYTLSLTHTHSVIIGRCLLRARRCCTQSQMTAAGTARQTQIIISSLRHWTYPRILLSKEKIQTSPVSKYHSVGSHSVSQLVEQALKAGREFGTQGAQILRKKKRISAQCSTLLWIKPSVTWIDASVLSEVTKGQLSDIFEHVALAWL